MKLLTHIIQISSAQFYFDWGNEPTGYISYGRYDQNDVYKFVGIGPKEWASQAGIQFNNPHS